MVVLADVPDIGVISNDEHLIWPFWHVADASELHPLLAEVLVPVSHAGLPLFQQVVEIGASAHVAAREAAVVFEPVDTTHSVHVALADHVLRALACIEVEDVNCARANRAGKQVPAMRELDLVALLQHKRVELYNLIR